MENNLYREISHSLCNKKSVDFTSRLKRTLDDIISFSDSCKSYCVCIVDIVNSTKITMTLPKSKVAQYYGIFLNTVAMISREFGATVVKNIGDSLLYYFPETSDISNKLSFVDVLECGMSMLESRQIINTKMLQARLPEVNYRISADYGIVTTAKSTNSSCDDIFGSTVNICSKINHEAMPNGMVIGSDLYQVVKSFAGYEFKPILACSTGLKLQYPVYSIRRQ